MHLFSLFLKTYGSSLALTRLLRLFQGNVTLLLLLLVVLLVSTNKLLFLFLDVLIFLCSEHGKHISSVLRNIVIGDKDREITRSMAQVVKSVASKAAQIASAPASVLRQFPPKEAVFNASTPTYFSPEVWANLQRPPSSALTSFAHRIGLANVIKNDNELLQACTHPTYPSFYSLHSPNAAPLKSNANLSTLGNSLMGLIATEYIHASYPHLPTRVVKAAVSAYVGPMTCATVAKEIGAAPLLRWNRPVRIFMCFESKQTLTMVCRTKLQQQNLSLYLTPLQPSPAPSPPSFITTAPSLSHENSCTHISSAVKWTYDLS